MAPAVTVTELITTLPDSVASASAAERFGASQLTVTSWLNGAASAKVTLRLSAAVPAVTAGVTPTVMVVAVQVASAGSTVNSSSAVTVAPAKP